MKHTVYVAGKRFILLSDDKEEYVQKVAQEVNDAIIKINAANPSLESRACAILCALDYADDMYKEIIKNQRFSEKAKEVMTQSDKHAKTIRELKEEIQKAKKLNENQLHQIADKNVEIKNLSNQVKDLSNEVQKLKEQLAKMQPKEEKQEIPAEKPQQKPVYMSKKQPYRNPVAKGKNNDKKSGSTETETTSMNQMSLFED